MILAVDIGNSIISLGAIENDEVVFVARMATDTTITSDEYASKILALFALRGSVRTEIDGAIIASVVPQLNSVIKGAVRSVFDKEALIVGPGVKTGIGIKCDMPSSVGADLICLSVAVKELYGAPAIIADLGTATNLVVIDESGAFVGCVISPGVAMGLEALSEKTAQLPRVSLDTPPSVIGKNTADCLRSGVLFGNAAMLDGLIDRICAEYGKKLPVYFTGGFSELIIPHLQHRVMHDSQLVLKGLSLIYKKTVR